jgi:hypothetical protein
MRGSYRTDRGRNRFGEVLTLAASLVLLGSLTGCGPGDSPSSDRLPSPRATSRTSLSVGVAHRGRGVGRCHLDSAVGLRKGRDDSKPVRCTRPHNLETVSSHPIYAKPTASALSGYSRDCYQDAESYLHVNVGEMNTRVFAEALATTQHGRTTVECDLGVTARLGAQRLGLPVVTRTSLRGQARAHHTASWHWCSNHLAASMALTDCTRPHRVEALLGPITLHLDNDRYPAGGTDHNARGDAVCRHAVARRADAKHLTVHSHWLSRAAWESEQAPPTLYGTCWFWRTDGSELPAIHDAGRSQHD